MPIPSAILLAEQLRSTSLEEVVGQTHLLPEGKPLRLALLLGKTCLVKPVMGSSEFAHYFAGTSHD